MADPLNIKGKALKNLKAAKNYVKKKVKSFGDGAPKKKATPKAKSNGMNAEQKKALKETQARNNLNKPKAKPKAKPSAQNKATNTNKANTGGSNAPMKDKGKAKVQPRQLDFNKAKISSAAIAGTGAGAGYIAGRSSGSKPAATRSAPTKGGGGGSQRTAPKYVEPKGGNIASRTDNSDGSKVGPNMSQVNKPDAKSAVEKDSRSTMQKLFGASEDKRAMGRNMQKQAQGLMQRPTSREGMKKGGAVKSRSRSINGIAVRGLTRAKHK
jgi:hypothetical protein